MDISRAMLVVLLATVLLAQVPERASAVVSGLDGQKAEPNSQVPATPPANSGNQAATLGQPNPAADAALQGRVQQALNNDPALSSSHISVSVTDSALELTGTADSIKSKETAERIAESFDGNRKFTDKLLVTGQNSGVRTPGQQK